MPFFQKVKSFFKGIIRPERIIDPARHHKVHEKFYKIARDMQKEHDFTKKQAIKWARKQLATPLADVSKSDRDIIQAHSP